MTVTDPLLLRVAQKHGCSPSICLAIWEDVNAIVEKVPGPQRFFLIGYRTEDKVGYASFSATTFPSVKEIQEHLKLEEKPVITLVHEFSEKDYNDFNK